MVLYKAAWCLTNRFHIAVPLVPNVDHRQNVVRPNKREARAIRWVCPGCSYPMHLYDICDLLPNRRTATWNLVLYNEETKNGNYFSHGSILEKITCNNPSNFNCKNNFDIFYYNGLYSIHICYECIIDNTIRLLIGLLKLWKLSLFEFLCLLRPCHRRTQLFTQHFVHI